MDRDADRSQNVTQFIFDGNTVVLRSASIQFDVQVIDDRLVHVRIWPEISDAELGVGIREFLLELAPRQALYLAQAVQSAAIAALDLGDR